MSPNADDFLIDGRWPVALRDAVRCGREECRGPRDALEGKGPPRPPQRRLDRRLEEVAEAVGGGYCRS